MNIPGSTKRVVTMPGYHVVSRYDLAQLRARKSGKGSRSLDVVLPLTSMIDMFSILVIFLILNFSATGEVFFVNKNIKIPEALHGQSMDSLALISITPQKVSLNSQMVGTDAEFSLSSGEMPGLVMALRNLRAMQESAVKAGIKVKTEINIQADQTTPVYYIKRVMNMLISEGFTGINFAVRPRVEDQ